jgi:uncharacterized protein (UPF0335 family)
MDAQSITGVDARVNAMLNDPNTDKDILQNVISRLERLKTTIANTQKDIKDEVDSLNSDLDKAVPR